MIGGVIDIRRMLRDLAGRTDNPLDDGRVEEHVSLDAGSPLKPGRVPYAGAKYRQTAVSGLKPCGKLKKNA